MINFEIIRSKKRRRTVSLSVEKNGIVIVSAPLKTSLKFIKEFVEKNSKWIEKKIEATKKENEIFQKREFHAGDTFNYLGENLILRVSLHSKKSKIQKSAEFIFYEKSFNADAKTDFEKWYKREAKKYMGYRITELAKRHNLHFKSVRFNAAKTRWGSCSPDNKISLNWKLMFASKEIVDYVILHELTHTKIKNHSEKFWKYLEMLMPDSKIHRKWLSDNGNLITDHLEKSKRNNTEQVTFTNSVSQLEFIL